MSKTLDFPSGKFWQVVRLTHDAPRTHWAVTWEIDYPFRTAQVKITKIFRWGFVRGKWQPGRHEFDTHLMMAIGGREIGEH